MPIELWESEDAESLRAALARRPLCDACLGRLFAQVGSGLTNVARGRQAREALDLSPAAACWLCEGLMAEVTHLAELVLTALEEWEYQTFLIGSILDPDLLDREETLWGEVGVRTYEPIKAEVNREVGKIVEARAGRPAEFTSPDITAILHTALDHVELQVAPFFLRGRYRKLVRGIPQTLWLCRECRGAGCEVCGNTGKRYETSVEEEIAASIVAALGGEGHSFHGMGREDIDARMLGRGRPFILEVRRPHRRHGPLREFERQIGAGGRVEVEGLSPASRGEVSPLKTHRCEKSYRVLAQLSREAPLQNLNEAVAALTASEIVQRTPTRVAHRRADRDRVRRVVRAELVAHREGTVELHLRAEAGTYIKELIHGDEGRTQPSLAALLDQPVTVQELDVLEIHDVDGHGEGIEGDSEADPAEVPQAAEG